MDDSEVVTRLLRYLASAFDCPNLAYAEAPARISGGRDAAIFRFSLQGAPEPIAGPLILRLHRVSVRGGRGQLQTLFHKWLAARQKVLPPSCVHRTQPSGPR